LIPFRISFPPTATLKFFISSIPLFSFFILYCHSERPRGIWVVLGGCLSISNPDASLRSA
ncbi:MAG: hypothetical protein ACRECJ_06035, partial [Limisphaerales bacterium]